MRTREKFSNFEQIRHLTEFFFSVTLKTVEETSEFGVSKSFSAVNLDLSRRLWGQMIDLETSEQIEDHDEIYTEGKRIQFFTVRLTNFGVQLIKA